MNRRDFLALSAAPLLAADTNWGGPVIDLHCHLRANIADNVKHNEGCGVTRAVLLTRVAQADQARAAQAAEPKKYIWFASTDVAKPEAEQILTAAVKSGARGLGELKSHVAADGPELNRMYDLAAEMKVPILVHFQEVDHFEGEGKWSTGFKNFANVLKKHPKTMFIGHADAFWANVSADYAEKDAYPAGPIVRGGVTDKLLSDYANLYGDLSANSGNNGLSRSPDFTKDFLKRHQDKLMFGSDCSCSDGKGGGVSQQKNPAASRLSGKCVARETLTLLKGATTPAVFQKLAWKNAERILHFPV